MMNYYEFCAKHGYVTTAEVDGHIHAGLRCAKTNNKRYMKWYQTELVRLQAARDVGLAAFRAAISAGEIAKPGRLERLLATANGHPDNQSVQAARRILQKQYNITVTNDCE